ncbi:MAG TPA: DinB family protein [Candidatus Acidoferrales bacterium]|nr:DinB family protein [Candidatus Acidoferrales bacterium]
MRKCIWLAMIALFAPLLAQAQATANPVVASAREIFERQSKYIAAATEEMPADKYNYHPTPDQWTFGKIASHVAQSSNAVCAMLSDTPAPDSSKISETDPKDTLVAAVKSSFDFCDKALANLQDSKLGDTITYFRGVHKPRARALVELTDDLEDHYSQMASYLRMNGMTPPSAKK